MISMNNSTSFFSHSIHGCTKFTTTLFLLFLLCFTFVDLHLFHLLQNSIGVVFVCGSFTLARLLSLSITLTHSIQFATANTLNESVQYVVSIESFIIRLHGMRETKNTRKTCFRIVFECVWVEKYVRNSSSFALFSFTPSS